MPIRNSNRNPGISGGLGGRAYGLRKRIPLRKPGRRLRQRSFEAELASGSR
jgi:hypothetical protein